MSKSSRSRAAEPTAHVDLEYPSSVPTFTVNPSQLSSSSSSPLPWFSAFGRKDANAPLPNEVDPKYSDPAYYASSSNYGKNGRNTSHTAKKPEGHIKRPPNCFLLFRSHVKESGIRIPDALKPILKDRLKEKRKEAKAKKASNRRNSGADEDDDEEEDDDDDNDDDEQSVSKISGILWDFLPAAEKSFFRARAAHAKSQHKKLYPNYKYSPQVKDKTVKRRVGKKMPTEKRERLEEVAGVLVREMGWATGEITVNKRSGTPASTSSKAELPSTASDNMPGTSAFGVPGYEHHHPQHQKTGSAPPPSLEMGVPPMVAMDPSAYGQQPRMERRPSSCPPPNAPTWSQPQAQAQTPPATASYGQVYPAPQAQWTYPPPPPAPTVAYVRPGGKTARKMRTGPSSAKAQILNGSVNKPSKKTRQMTSTPVMELPSLPTILKATSSEVPMSTGTYETQQQGEIAWGMAHYDQSQHSSPQTFSSSAPPSVLLETPPFHAQMQYHQQHPQQQVHMFDFSQQSQQQQSFDAYQMPPPPPQQQTFTYSHSPLVVSTKADEVAVNNDDGELGLTLIDQHYTFPPMTASVPSPTGSPRGGSPPRAPSQRDESQRKWTKSQIGQHQNSPLGKPRKPTRLNTTPPPSATASSTSEAPYSAAPTLLSPTPVTPISSQNLHQQSLDDLGVDLNLNMGGDPSSATSPGNLEFHFPGGTDQYGMLLGGANAHVLLGDVALGMHDDISQHQQQQYYTMAPVDPLYAEDGLLAASFDPSNYLEESGSVDLTAAAVEEMQMTSTQQLEYEMMEWRRGSAGTQGRRPSVSLGMALGNDVGVALYGYDASAPQEYQQYQPEPAHPSYAVAYPLGTVMERAESEEREEPRYHPHQQQQQQASPYGGWVAQSA